MKGKALILMILLLLLVNLKFLNAGSANFVLVDAYWTIPLVAGADNTLIVKVEYKGSGTAENINATLKLLNVAGSDLEANDSYTGSLTYGQRLQFSFTFTIPADAKASYYNGILTLEYLENNIPIVESLEFQVGFFGSPSFSIKSSTNTLTRGKTTQVTLTVTVEESPARNVEIRVTPASPFVNVIGGNLDKSGVVEVGDKLNISLKLAVDSNAGDSVAISVTITYSDFSQTPGTQTETIGFNVVGYQYPQLKVSLSPTKIVSGKASYLYVTVKNTGGSMARQVYATITPSSPGVAVLQGSSQSLGDIPPSSSKSFSILVKAEKKISGSATLLLTLSYYDESGDSHATTMSLGFEVERGYTPILTISSSTKSLPLEKNTSITIEISNIGDGKAEDIVIDIISGQGFMVLSNSRFYISELEPGELESLQLEVYASSIFEESAVVNVRLKYYDQYGEEYDDLLNLAFIVEEPGKPLLDLIPLNDTLLPNKVNKILFMVYNRGYGPAKNVTVSFASQSLEIGSLIGSSTYLIEKINANQSLTLEYKIFIQPKVYGAIQLIASISYQDEYGNYYNRLQGVGFKVEGSWELSVLQTKTMPAILFPGDKNVKLTVYLANIGDYMAKNVNLTLIRGEYIKPATTSAGAAFIPYLPVGEKATLVFLINIDEETPPGNHEIIIKADSQNVMFKISVLEKAKFKVSNVTKIEVYPGQRGYSITLSVENDSDFTVEDVRIDLYSPFITGTVSTRIGEMQPHEKRLAVFEVDVDDATPIGQVPLEVRVSWTQDGRSLSESYRLAINVYERKIPLTFYIALVVLIAVSFAVFFRKTTLFKILKEKISYFRVKAINVPRKAMLDAAKTVKVPNIKETTINIKILTSRFSAVSFESFAPML